MQVLLFIRSSQSLIVGGLKRALRVITWKDEAEISVNLKRTEPCRYVRVRCVGTATLQLPRMADAKKRGRRIASL